VLQWNWQLSKRTSCMCVLQCDAVCCSVLLSRVLRCVAKLCNVLQWNRQLSKRTSCMCALQCVVACCSVLWLVAACCSLLQCFAVYYNILEYVGVCCDMLQCVAVCSLVAVCCSEARLIHCVLQWQRLLL